MLFLLWMTYILLCVRIRVQLEAELTEDEENVYKVFDRFLEERKVAEDRIDTLRSTYREAVVMMHETDGGAE